MKEIHELFYDRIKKIINKDRIFTRPLHTLCYGTDASIYRLNPAIVIKAANEQEIADIVKLSGELNVPLTFKGAGSSLSGQASTDSVLVIASSDWQGCFVDKCGDHITAQPGVIGSHMNVYLKPHGKKIGPDPASINSALIGGIVANNASGMCCRLDTNSYSTIKDVSVILANGSFLDTSDAASVENFLEENGDIVKELEDLAQEVQKDKKLSAFIKKKYSMKNTTGYSINSLTDYSCGIEILKHLMVGSEGTLGFLSNITLKTIPDEPYKVATLAIYPDISTASNAISQLNKNRLDVDTAEFMDRLSLKAVEDTPSLEYLKDLPDGACAVLIQLVGNTSDELNGRIDKITNVLKKFKTVLPYEFSSDVNTIDGYWKVRKGLFPAVGALRRKGTSVIIEDITFPPERLAEGTKELQELFTKHNMKDTIIFGHALEGNHHFILTIDYNDQNEIDLYEAFIKDLVKMITEKYQGSLKAEHGTGRNMAPFVEAEWGAQSYALMKRIKEILDPKNILNPDVIITEDSEIYLKNFKTMPQADDIVDKCIECGFCEPLCPSKDITITPRQRIVVYREVMSLRKSGQFEERLHQIEKDFVWDSVTSCAICGLCSTACPLKINVGELTLKLKRELEAHKNASLVRSAKNFTGYVQKNRAMLSMAHMSGKVIGKKNISSFTKLGRTLISKKLPYMPSTMPTPAPHVDFSDMPASDLKFVYIPSCANRMMGVVNHKDAYKKSMMQVVKSLSKKTGFEVIIPDEIDKLCCGVVFKNSSEAQKYKEQEIKSFIIKYSEYGKYPVLSDLSTCSLALKAMFEGTSVEVKDLVEFAMEHWVDKLSFKKTNEKVAIHSTCSLRRLGLDAKLVELTKMCTDNVVVPQKVGCCGFSGDKGIQYPKLNSAALEFLADEIKDCQRGVSVSTICEMGLTERSKIAYQSVLHLVDDSTTSAKYR